MSALRKHNLLEAVAYPNDEKLIFEAADIFVKNEGFLPAPESTYAVRAGIDEALKAKKENRDCVIAMNISGHGFLDMQFYTKVNEMVK